MSHAKIKHYLLLILVLFAMAKIANASLEITEVMYSPESGSDHEWVEIFNNGSSPVSMDKYRFFHGDTNGPITLKSGSTSVLQPSKYAIIAKSLTDYSWLNFTDIVFSSSALSLPDSGDNTYIAISDSNKSIIDSVTYDVSKGGSKISKSSLSKINNDWTSGVPTPGANNDIMVISSDTVVDSNGNSTSNDDSATTSSSNVSSTQGSNSSSNKEDIPIILKTTTKIISTKVVVAGIPFSLASLTSTNMHKTYNVGNFVWNFGDGMTRKIGVSEPFEYTYEYPGEYVLTLSYYDNYFSKTPDATDRITIKVIPSDVYISSVGNNSDPYIEIGNKSTYEVLLSNWVVTAGSHYFIIPEGTTLLPGKKIKLASKITGFIGEDLITIKISNPSNEVIVTYPIQSVAAVRNRVFSTSTRVDNSSTSPAQENSKVIDLNNLEANAAEAKVNIPNSTIFYIFCLLGVILIGIVSFLLIKKNNEPKDYVEKAISASDMTIIE